VSILSSVTVYACDRCGVLSLKSHRDCPVCAAEDNFCEVELLETMSGLQIMKHPVSKATDS
jgi:RNA polymerase subunit RPABC4/transcription elongation factor Spt4